MARSPIEYEIMAALRMTPRDAISQRTLRGVVVQEGIEVSKDEFEAVCTKLLEEGTIDFERGGSTTRYLIPEPDGIVHDDDAEINDWADW